MLRNHMLGSANLRSTGQVRRRVSRMAAVTLPAVRMALFCDIVSGTCGIVTLPVECMALFCHLWYVRHYSVTLLVVCMLLLFFCCARIVCFNLIVMAFSFCFGCICLYLLIQHKLHYLQGSYLKIRLTFSFLCSML
jgi:hypothetical protein